MADYIYLTQNRLTPAQWRALEAVRESARAHGLTVFLVGGAVRDLTSGSPVRDLDFAVQGAAEALLPELEAAGAVVAGRNSALSSLYLTMRGGVRVEIGPALSVNYSKPGVPQAEPASILDDLRRRDFTANAMAVSLNEGSYGLLLDPLNGTADIENRELRLVSNYGFLEQPASLLRAARLSGRLGWTLEERTQARYNNAKQEGYIEKLGEAERRYEIEEIFHEEDPISALEQMTAEGWGESLQIPLNASKVDSAGLDQVRDLVGQMEALGLFPDASAVNFSLLTGKLSDEEVVSLKKRFARPGFVQQIDSLEARGKELAAQLGSKAAAQPSETWKMLFAAEPEIVLYLARSSRSGAITGKLKAFLQEWPAMRQKLPYGLMQEMRITPDLPQYEQLLDDLFFALIDGKLATIEATKAFLEPYSPPAPPPQVSVRRRAAKSTKGRSRKVVDEEPAAADDLAGDLGEESAERELETEESTPALAAEADESELQEPEQSSGPEAVQGPASIPDEAGLLTPSVTEKQPAEPQKTSRERAASAMVPNSSKLAKNVPAAKTPGAEEKKTEPTHSKPKAKVTGKPSASAPVATPKRDAGKGPLSSKATAKLAKAPAKKTATPAASTHKAPTKSAMKSGTVQSAANSAHRTASKAAPTKKQGPVKTAAPAKKVIAPAGKSTSKKAAKPAPVKATASKKAPAKKHR